MQTLVSPGQALHRASLGFLISQYALWEPWALLQASLTSGLTLGKPFTPLHLSVLI
jgi:hypothetical protein